MFKESKAAFKFLVQGVWAKDNWVVHGELNLDGKLCGKDPFDALE